MIHEFCSRFQSVLSPSNTNCENSACIIFCSSDTPTPPVTETEPNDQSSEEPSSTSSTSSSSFFSSSSSSSSSSSATATPTGYYIIPNNNAGITVLNAFTVQLKTETDPDTMWVSGAPAANYVVFWYQVLNSTLFATYKQNLAVSCSFRYMVIPLTDSRFRVLPLRWLIQMIREPKILQPQLSLRLN